MGGLHTAHAQYQNRPFVTAYTAPVQCPSIGAAREKGGIGAARGNSKGGQANHAWPTGLACKWLKLGQPGCR